MKRLVIGLTAMAVALFGVGGLAHAYPPDAPSGSVDTQTPVPGGSVTVTVNDCPDGPVSVVLGGQTANTTSSGGTATATLTAPSEPGSYTISFTCGDAVGSLTVTVTAPATTPAPGLPATGGSGFGTSAVLALGLLLIGLAILGVGRARRLPVRS